jgi:hypothetical protein
MNKFIKRYLTFNKNANNDSIITYLKEKDQEYNEIFSDADVDELTNNLFILLLDKNLSKSVVTNEIINFVNDVRTHLLELIKTSSPDDIINFIKFYSTYMYSALDLPISQSNVFYCDIDKLVVIILQRNLLKVFCKIVFIIDHRYEEYNYDEYVSMLKGFINMYDEHFDIDIVIEKLMQYKSSINNFDLYVNCIFEHKRVMHDVNIQQLLELKPQLKTLLINSKYKDFLLNDLKFKDVTTEQFKSVGMVCYKSIFGVTFVFNLDGTIFYIGENECTNLEPNDISINPILNIVLYHNDYTYIVDSNTVDDLYLAFIWKFLNIVNTLLINAKMFANLPKEILDKYNFDFNVRNVHEIKNVDPKSFCKFIKDVCNYAITNDVSILLNLKEVNDVCLTNEVKIIIKLL